MCQPKLTQRTTITALLAALALSTTGCDELLDSFGSVSGEVMGQPFQFSSGVADADGRGNYLITLSDDYGFDCFSSPSGNYLSIVIANVDGPGTYSASRYVTFNSYENNINYSDSAFSGSVTIDEIDTEFDYTISGSISASSTDSNVSGSFTVEICE